MQEADKKGVPKYNPVIAPVMDIIQDCRHTSTPVSVFADR